MKPPSRDRANRKPPTPTAGTGTAEQRPRRYRARDLRVDATPEQLAAVIGAGPPKAPHEWNYPNGRPAQSPVDMLNSRRSATSGGKECYLDLSANCPNDRHRLVLAPRTSGHSSIARETTVRSCSGHDQA